MSKTNYPQAGDVWRQVTGKSLNRRILGFERRECRSFTWYEELDDYNFVAGVPRAYTGDWYLDKDWRLSERDGEELSWTIASDDLVRVDIDWKSGMFSHPTGAKERCSIHWAPAGVPGWYFAGWGDDEYIWYSGPVIGQPNSGLWSVSERNRMVERRAKYVWFRKRAEE